MADESVANRRAEIIASYGLYMAELRAPGPSWEVTPLAPGGEPGWSARHAAEHVARAGAYVIAGMAQALGIDGPPQQHSFADANAAIAAMPGVHDALMDVLNHIHDDQLLVERDYGPLGVTSFGAVLVVLADHYRDHANQLRALRGS